MNSAGGDLLELKDRVVGSELSYHLKVLQFSATRAGSNPEFGGAILGNSQRTIISY